ncbi:MAG: hypothetical protein R3D63_10375 [Paracoccaceae bacterium]
MPGEKTRRCLTLVKVAGASAPDKQAMSMLRPLFCLLAALAFALSGAAVAAQAVRGPVAEVVICGDHGPESIRVDARGNKVDGKTCCECLDCLGLAFAAPPEPASGPGAPVRLTKISMPEAGAQLTCQRPLHPLPRGPPIATPVVWSILTSPVYFPASLEFHQVLPGNGVATGGQSAKVAR